MVTVKIRDGSHFETTTVNMFAYSAMDLPKITAVGDIIYLKDAQMQTYSRKGKESSKNGHQIIFNVASSNVWAIYSGLSRNFQLPSLTQISSVPPVMKIDQNKLEIPIQRARKGLKKIYFEQQELNYIKFLRNWTLSYYGREVDIFDIRTTIDVSGDFDLMGLVKNIAYIDGHSNKSYAATTHYPSTAGKKIDISV